MNVNLAKYRIFNKTNFAMFFILLFLMFFSYITENIQVFNYLPSTFDYEEYAAERNEELSFEELEQHRIWLLKNIYLRIDTYMWAGQQTAILLLALAPLAATVFINERKGLFQFEFVRNKGYVSTILKSMLSNAFIAACFSFAAFVVYFSVGKAFVYPTYSLAKPGFDFIEENFFENHVYLYYFFEGFIIYFLTAFVYCFIGCVIYFWTNKKYLAVLIPIGYVIVASIVFQAFPYNVIWQILTPTSAFGIASVLTPELDEAMVSILSSLVPFALSVVTLIYKLKGMERL